MWVLDPCVLRSYYVYVFSVHIWVLSIYEYTYVCNEITQKNENERKDNKIMIENRTRNAVRNWNEHWFLAAKKKTYVLHPIIVITIIITYIYRISILYLYACTVYMFPYLYWQYIKSTRLSPTLLLICFRCRLLLLPMYGLLLSLFCSFRTNSLFILAIESHSSCVLACVGAHVYVWLLLPSTYANIVRNIFGYIDKTVNNIRYVLVKKKWYRWFHHSYHGNKQHWT